MRNLRAKVSDPNSFTSDPGSRFRPVYGSRIAPDGSLYLEKQDEIDLRAEYNAQRDQTDMSYILARLNIGDTSVLNRRAAMYGDFTEVPKSMAEVMQAAINAESAFAHLPLSVRDQYLQDWHKWLADAGSEKWLKVMSDFLPAVDPKQTSIEEVVKEVEKSES